MARKPIGEMPLSARERKEKSDARKSLQRALETDALNFIRSDLILGLMKDDADALAHLVDLRKRADQFFSKPARNDTPTKLTAYQRKFLVAASEQNGLIIQKCSPPVFHAGSHSIHQTTADILLAKGMVTPVPAKDTSLPVVHSRTPDGSVESYQYMLTPFGFEIASRIADVVTPREQIISKRPALSIK